MARSKDKRPATGRSTRVRPLDDGPSEAGFGPKANPTIPKEVSLPGGGNSDLDLAFDKTQVVDPDAYKAAADGGTGGVKFNPTRLNPMTQKAPPPAPAVPPQSPPAPYNPEAEFEGPTEYVDATAFDSPSQKTALAPHLEPEDERAPTVPPTPPPLDLSDETHDDLQHQDQTVSWAEGEGGPSTKQQPIWLANAQSIDLKRPSTPAPVGMPPPPVDAGRRGTSYLVPYLAAGIGVFALAFLVAFFAGRDGTDDDTSPDEDPTAAANPEDAPEPLPDDLPQPLDTPPVDLEPPAPTKQGDRGRVPVRISLVDDISGSGFPRLTDTLKRDIRRSLKAEGPFIPGSRLVDKGFEASLWIKSARVNRGANRSIAKVNCSMAAKPAGSDTAKMFEATGRITHDGPLVQGLDLSDDSADDALDKAEASLAQEAVRACGTELSKMLAVHVAQAGGPAP